MKALILCILLLGVPGAQASARTRQPALAITGATLLDGTGGAPLAHAVVLLEGDRIARVGTVKTVSIPPGARRIDATGKYLTPGLIDTHLHLEQVGLSDIGSLPPTWDQPEMLRRLITINAQLDLMSGFTTIRDLGSTEAVLHVRDDIEAGRVVGPRILAAGMQLVEGSASHDEPMFLGYVGPDSARSQVRRLAGLGVDVIKIRLTHRRVVPSLEEVRAIVAEAHRLGLRATVHTDVPADDLVLLAIDAGADGIEHNAPLRSKDGHLLERMAQAGMSLMAGSGAFWLQRIDSTGMIDALDPSQERLYPEDVRAALHFGADSLHRQTRQMKDSGWSATQRQATFVREVQRARAAGVLLAFGTDCGAYGMVHGEQYKALYGESRIGSSPMQALVMATRDAARAIGRTKDLGTVEPGKLADLLILDADPLADLRNVHRVFRVVKAGVVYDPSAMMGAPR